GTTIFDKTFTTLSDAQAFFTNDALDLGTFASGPNQVIDFNLSLTTSGSGTGFGAQFLLGTTPTGGNQPPVTTVPGPQSVQQGATLAIPGISVADGDAESANETITAVLSDSTGLLSASGAGVSGSGTTALTISGTLSQVNS